MGSKQTQLIIARVQVSQLLLDLYKRAVAERKIKAASTALQLRIRLLQAMREKRGYEI